MAEPVSKLNLLSAVIPILNRYSEELKDRKETVCSTFIEELSEAIGSKSEQDANETLLYLDEELRSHPVLCYAMQHRTDGPLEEEKPRLAKAYGLKDYDDPQRIAKQETYWKNFFTSHNQRR